MAQALGELAEQGAPVYQNAQPVLNALIKAEVAEREVRSVAYQKKSARFPVYRGHGYAGFRFRLHSKAPSIRRRWCVSYTAVDFMDQAQNTAACWSRGGPVGHRQDAPGHRHRRARHRTPAATGALLLHHRTGQRTRT